MKKTELDNIITEMKNTLGRINSRITEAEEANWKTESWKSLPRNKIEKKIMKRNKDSLRDFWNDIKCINSHIIGFPE